jgi:hypothetical protein
MPAYTEAVRTRSTYIQHTTYIHTTYIHTTHMWPMGPARPGPACFLLSQSVARLVAASSHATTTSSTSRKLLTLRHGRGRPLKRERQRERGGGGERAGTEGRHGYPRQAQPAGPRARHHDIRRCSWYQRRWIGAHRASAAPRKSASGRGTATGPSRSQACGAGHQMLRKPAPCAPAQSFS